MGTFAIFAALLLLNVGGVILMIWRFYRRTPCHEALVVLSPMLEPQVHFGGGTVLPIVARGEVLRLATTRISLQLAGDRSLSCRDGLRADIAVSFFVRVNRTKDDMLRVARLVGCERAADPLALEALFGGKFKEAVRIVAKGFDFEDLFDKGDQFHDQVIDTIGRDFNGFVLDEIAVEDLRQTPIQHLNPNRIMDVPGLLKMRGLEGTT